jgi:hypothetical protein
MFLAGFDKAFTVKRIVNFVSKNRTVIVATLDNVLRVSGKDVSG